jgi:hypothetical protein
VTRKGARATQLPLPTLQQRSQHGWLLLCSASVALWHASRTHAGRNWGDVTINSSSLLYRVEGKTLLEVPLPDVSQAQQTKVCMCIGAAVWCVHACCFTRVVHVLGT